MIFVDANVFIRFIVAPATAQDREWALQSRSLFERARAGLCALTTSDATVAEVAFILTSRNHYKLERQEAANRIKTILLLDGFRYNETDACLRGLDLWIEHPKLSFPDALAAAYSERYGHELATFDGRLRALAVVRTYDFSGSAG